MFQEKKNIVAQRPEERIANLTRSLWKNVADAFNSSKAEDVAKTMMELFDFMTLLICTSEQQEQKESAGYEDSMYREMGLLRRRLCSLSRALQVASGQQHTRTSMSQVNNFFRMYFDLQSRYRRDRMLIMHFVDELNKLKLNLNYQKLFQAGGENYHKCIEHA